MFSCVDRDKVKEVITVFKKYADKLAEKAKNAADVAPKSSKKMSLFDMDTETDKWLQMAGYRKNDKMLLAITMKKTPTNRSTFINLIGPLPYSYHDLTDSTICLIVKNINRKEKNEDRELELRLTREYYKDKLLEAGFDSDFVNQRVYILPMKELLTEYNVPELRSKLVSQYDVFLAESSLINNKFKTLPTFLGSKFWMIKKKFPLPVCFYKTSKIKREIMNALAKTSFYITGHGPDVTIQFGVFKQSVEHLTDNLMFVLQELYRLMKTNVQILKVKSLRSIAIPFYADLRPVKLKEFDDNLPKSKPLSKPVVDDFPLHLDSKAVVYPDGSVKIVKIKKRKTSDGNYIEDNNEEWYLKSSPKVTRKLIHFPKKKIGSKKIGSKKIGSKKIGSKKIGSKKIGLKKIDSKKIVKKDKRSSKPYVKSK